MQPSIGGSGTAFNPEKSNLRYTLYAPDSLSCRNSDGMNKFRGDDYQGKFASIEFAKKAGSIKAWYQIVDSVTNKVIEENIKSYCWEDGLY